MTHSTLARGGLVDTIQSGSMKTLLLIIWVAMLGGPALLAEDRITWFEGPRVARLEFKLTPEGKPFVKVKMGGRDAFLFIDTGATTILDKGVAESLGLTLRETDDVATGLTGVAGRRYAASVDLQIGQMKISNLPVSCLDLSAVRALNRQQGVVELDGLIGSDLLAVLKARIDYETGSLTIRRPNRL